MGLDSVVVQIEADEALDRVWWSLPEPSEQAAWLADRASVRAESGGQFEFHWEPNHPDGSRTTRSGTARWDARSPR